MVAGEPAVRHIYSEILFPWGCDRLMSAPKFTELRRQVLSGATGDVLEIGGGTGLNLPHYPASVRRLTTVDPNDGMNRRARKRAATCGIEVDCRAVSGESLPLEDASFDTVVSTWTLCSIPDVQRAMREVVRVLRPEGRFVFVEHGLSDDPAVQRWQRWLNPVQKLIGDGCHLDRDMQRIVTRSGLQIAELDKFYMDDAPRFAGFLYRGIAVKTTGV